MERVFFVLIVLYVLCVNGGNIESCDNSTDYEDVTLKLAVILTKTGQNNESQDELQKLKNYPQNISSVFTHLYAGDITNTERTLDMLKSIHCAVHANSALALFQEMRKHGNSGRPEFFLVQSFLQDIRSHCCGNEEMDTANAELEPYVAKSLDTWVDHITNGTNDQIYQFMKSHGSTDYFLMKIPELIKKVFTGNATSLNSVMAFVNDLPFVEYVNKGYAAVIQGLKEIGKEHSDEMLLLAYWIHQKELNMTIKDNATLSKFNELKNEIPLTIQNIFWKPTCTIKNLQFGDYLDAADTPSFGSNGVAFTRYQSTNYTAGGIWRTAMCNEDSSWYNAIYKKWILRPILSGEVETAFLLKSALHESENQGYLQAAEEDTFDTNRRVVRDATLQNSSYWRIECREETTVSCDCNASTTSELILLPQ